MIWTAVLSFIATLLLSQNTFAVSVAEKRVQDLAYSKHWLRLLHYKKKLLGGYKSTVDGREFFFARDGKSNPESELRETLRAFERHDLKIGRLRQHPQCAFPERFRFLKTELALKVKEAKCAEFEEWKKGLGARSLTFIYSTAYPNNPASMFGHTLLRLNRNTPATASTKHDLLSYGVNYAAAVPDTDGGMKFAILGLFGGYDGFFSLAPYYMKVNEYNNAESRDLWEYDLNLTPEQVGRMVNHVWELYATAEITYFFIDDNCAMQMLELLEVANPDWDLSSGLSTYVLPADTVKKIAAQKNSIRSVRVRPSIRRKTLARVDALSQTDRTEFHKALSGEIPVGEVASAAPLDALLSYLDYLKNRDSGKLDDEKKALFRNTLLKRATLPATSSSDPVIHASNTRPDLGHHSSALLARISHRRDEGKVLGFGFKWGLHDLLNDDTGYEPYSQIDFFTASVDYLVDQKKLRFRDATLFELTSLHALEALDPRFSWRASLKFDQFRDIECDYCHGVMADGGAGLTFGAFSDRLIFYALTLAYVEAGRGLPGNVRAGPGAILATLLNPIASYKLQLSMQPRYDLVGAFDSRFSTRFELNQALSLSQSMDLRLGAILVPRGMRGLRAHQEIDVNIRYYY